MLSVQKIFFWKVLGKNVFKHFVDWNKGMLSQIPKLGDRYTDWVNKPLDRKLKLFDNEFMESLTKVWTIATSRRQKASSFCLQTPWYMPLAFWVPIILFLIAGESMTTGCVSWFLWRTKFVILLSTKILHLFFQSKYVIFWHLLSGAIFWTILEYNLHRFVFHMNVKNHPKWASFHFTIHGMHHKVA